MFEMKFLKGFVIICASYIDCIVWVKCATSAECKTIRIAVSAVMDVLVMPLKVRHWFWFQKGFVIN